MRDFTKKQLEIIVAALALDKGLDFITGGWINKQSRKALIAVTKRLLPIAGQASVGIGRLAGRSAIGAIAPLAANPYVAGTALGLGALQTEPGQDLLAWAEEKGKRDRVAFEQYKTDVAMRSKDFLADPVGFASQIRPIRSGEERLLAGLTGKKRKTSKFNSAIKKGMAAIKKSTSYGKKGKINNAKKAFTLVTKTVSKLMRGKKVSSKGPTGIVKKSLPGISKIIVRNKK